MIVRTVSRAAACVPLRAPPALLPQASLYVPAPVRGAVRTYAATAAPHPNDPYQVFDRAAKQLQKARAARRTQQEPVGTPVAAVAEAEAGAEAESPARTNAEAGVAVEPPPSRVTDYLRDQVAANIADRLSDIARPHPIIVEIGAGAGHLRRFLDFRKTQTEKLIMCDANRDLLYRDEPLDNAAPYAELSIERRVLDEELLAHTFGDNSCDVIVATGGLHWTNDLLGTLIQIRRALKPDGVFIGALAGGDTLFELRTSLQLAEMEREGGVSARVSPMATSADMANLLGRAGFSMPTVDVDEVAVGYPSMYELVQDLRDMGESNATLNRRTQLSRDTLLAAGAIYQSLHGMEDEEGVPATFTMIYLVRHSSNALPLFLPLHQYRLCGTLADAPAPD